MNQILNSESKFAMFCMIYTRVYKLLASRLNEVYKIYKIDDLLLAAQQYLQS
jgi:hypothetical protein